MPLTGTPKGPLSDDEQAERCLSESFVYKS